MTAPARPVTWRTVPWNRPALNQEQAAALQSDIESLSADFPGWHAWVSDDPAGMVYATRLGVTEHARTAERMREILAARTQRAGKRETALLDSFGGDA